jgi:hypothetical protein
MMYLWYLCFRAEIVRWVAESVRPFSIVEDRGFKLLMKTEYYLPSTSTVSRDVRLVFGRTRERISKMLQVRISTFILSEEFKTYLGIRGWHQFRNWCLDVPKPLRICCPDCTSWSSWTTDFTCSWCRRSPKSRWDLLQCMVMLTIDSHIPVRTLHEPSRTCCVTSG